MSAPDTRADPGASAPSARRGTEPDLDRAVTRVEQELGRFIGRIRVDLREAAVTVHPDLQPLGYQVLASIATGKATSAGAIIERLRTDKSAVSRQVGQLEQWGLVESVRDPDDRRAKVLVATDLARERIAIARSRYEERIGDRLRKWSAEDVDHFADLLAELSG